MEGKDIHGNGFTFANYSADELKERTQAALSLWYDAPLRRKFVSRIMNTDFSWGASANRYKELYAELLPASEPCPV